MNSREKSERYGEMISGASPAAAAEGKREPYRLTFLKKHGKTVPMPEKTECGGTESLKNGTECLENAAQGRNGTKTKAEKQELRI